MKRTPCGVAAILLCMLLALSGCMAQSDGETASGTEAIKGTEAATEETEATLVIQSGTFTIPYCYEGIEGLSVTIEDGIFEITSTDDGLNAAGGADASGFGGFGGRQQDTFAATSDSFITINDGTFTIVSSGDCLDSNGALTINGGMLDLTCNGNGDTALDCDGTYTNHGGTVTTNDGSESNPGQMGGGMGGQEGVAGPGGMGGQAGKGGQGNMENPENVNPPGEMEQIPST